MSRSTLQKSLLAGTLLLLSQSAFSATLEEKAKAIFGQNHTAFNCEGPLAWAEALGQDVLYFGLIILDDAQKFHDLINGKTQAKYRSVGEVVADVFNPFGQILGTTYYYTHQAEHAKKVEESREGSHDFHLKELCRKIFLLEKLIRESVNDCDDPKNISPCAAYFMTAFTKLSIAIAEKKELFENLTSEGHIELLGTNFFDVTTLIERTKVFFFELLPSVEEENKSFPVYEPKRPQSPRTTVPKGNYDYLGRKQTSSIYDID